MDEDHPVAFCRDITPAAVLPVVQRTTEAVADDTAMHKIRALMQTMCRQSADYTVMPPAKENDGKVAEFESKNLAGR
jgi:hypothetical protein